MSDYEDKVRSHEFDGIQEYDNRLPNWWLWTLYLSCIFSVGYWIHYHTLGTGDLPEEAYLKASQARAERYAERMAAIPVSDEILRSMAQEASTVAQGRQVFVANCASCHKEDLSGFLGENLTDHFWIYGNTPTEIFGTVMDGTPGGMQPWGSIIGKSKVMQAVAFVLTQTGTEREGKPPAPNAKKIEPGD